MSSDAEMHLANAVAHTPVQDCPFPYCFVRDVFPDDFYAAMLEHLPDSSSMIPIEKARGVVGYAERYVLNLTARDLATLPDKKRAFWEQFSGWFLHGRMVQAVLGKFSDTVEQRTREGITLEPEAHLIEDLTNHRIGPHTDAPKKVITMLFYLPKDDSRQHLGTSIYVPKDSGFSSADGQHHPFESFDRVVTMPFTPNSVFAFARTNNTFHGVEPVTDLDCRRWLLSFNIYAKARS